MWFMCGVLDNVLQHQLFVKAEKFHRTTTSSLRFLISPGKVRMDLEKVNAMNWPMITDGKQLQHFLGFANFDYRFIQNISQIAAPLHALTTKFSRSPVAKVTFWTLLSGFSSSSILLMLNPK